MNPTQRGFGAILDLGRRLPRRHVVVGASMEPTLAAGDRVLVLPIRRVRMGTVVAGTDPRDGRMIVKRVAGIGPAGIDLRGDNESASTDSRTFGPVGRASIIGAVVYRYAPPGRVGRITPQG